MLHATCPLLLSGRREILTLGEGFNTQVITLWCFYIVGREILTLGEGFNTQVITLWCFYTVGREILTLGEGFNTQVITLWCFYIVLRSRGSRVDCRAGGAVERCLHRRAERHRQAETSFAFGSERCDPARRGRLTLSL
jgi:hypothetical protein